MYNGLTPGQLFILYFMRLAYSLRDEDSKQAIFVLFICLNLLRLLTVVLPRWLWVYSDAGFLDTDNQIRHS